MLLLTLSFVLYALTTIAAARDRAPIGWEDDRGFNSLDPRRVEKNALLKTIDCQLLKRGVEKDEKIVGLGSSPSEKL